MDKTILIRPDEAALRLGISRTKVYQLLADGKIPSVRIGRSIRIPVDKLNEWVRVHTTDTALIPAEAASIDKKVQVSGNPESAGGLTK